MKEHKIFTLFLIFLLISGFVIGVYEFRMSEFREFNEKTMLDYTFSEAIYQNSLVYEKVNFNDIADFEWSQLLLIRSYMNPRQVFEDEGLRWQNIRTSIKYHDGITLIVFLYDNQIVAFRDHSREMGDFLADGNTHLIRYGYSIFDRKDANFGAQFNRGDRMKLIHRSYAVDS
jgi:hypothetical protein